MTNYRGVIARLMDFWAWLNSRSVSTLFLTGLALLIGSPVAVVFVFYCISSSLIHRVSYSPPLPIGLAIVEAIGVSLFRFGSLSGLGLIALSAWRLIFKVCSWLRRGNSAGEAPDATCD